MAVTVASGILRPSPSTRAVECGLPVPRCCSLRCSLFAAPIPSKIRFCFPRFLLQLVDVDIATHIDVYDDGPDRSLLVVETADYPGLLVDLVKIITDINIAVQSGEFDTEVLSNSLRYFLRRPTTEEASF
ncbi:hypothetical protein B296_00001317 [Ensete ventricosum]|uniref:ACT domain-containing protein n=1 Tax=Ensete ventricosum TaxID=4639 RepID=A0A427B5G0_ENSVE|nr:hypothetical protein B296_00001317 [Ensete ventricosum]